MVIESCLPVDRHHKLTVGESSEATKSLTANRITLFWATVTTLRRMAIEMDDFMFNRILREQLSQSPRTKLRYC